MADRDLDDQGVEDTLKGKGRKLKGRMKDAAGGLTGDESLQAEGKWDQATGKAREALGDAERKVDEARSRSRDRSDRDR